MGGQKQRGGEDKTDTDRQRGGSKKDRQAERGDKTDRQAERGGQDRH